MAGCLFVTVDTTTTYLAQFIWHPSGLNLRWAPSIFPKGPAAVTRVMLPLWIPALIAGGAAFYFHRKARVPGPGHCPKCGYNLAGNTSGVCPECGRAVR